MRLTDPARPAPRESIVPMINVVFLLLIFFLMFAVIAPRAPLSVALPQAAGAGVSARAEVLYVASDGALAYGDLRDEAVWAELGGAGLGGAGLGGAGLGGAGPLAIRADRALPATEMAALARRLQALGHGPLELIVEPQP